MRYLVMAALGLTLGVLGACVAQEQTNRELERMSRDYERRQLEQDQKKYDEDRSNGGLSSIDFHRSRPFKVDDRSAPTLELVRALDVFFFL